MAPVYREPVQAQARPHTPTGAAAAELAPRERPFVAGLVLAAGRSERLGQPKQLLPYRGGTLLEWAHRQAVDSRLDQVVVVLGAHLAALRDARDWGRASAVVNTDQGAGCSASYHAGLAAVEPRAEAVVVLLGDQPGVERDAIDRLLSAWAATPTPLALVRYRDGLGHPFLFARGLFPELGRLHGDKAAWKIVDRLRDAALLLPDPRPIPRDVDTWDDYRALLAAGATG
jgi:molybdenum cofactor cytidylyltransferase